MKRDNIKKTLIKNSRAGGMLRFLPGASMALCMACSLASCEKSEPVPDPEPSSFRTSILIYAVASNNLSYDFANDMAEVKEAAASIDLSKVDVWVYSLTPKNDPTLARLKKENDEYVFETVKDYDRLTYSTDPARISEVIGDYRTLSPSENRGLIFWSHATGWSPNFSDHIVPEPERGEDTEESDGSFSLSRYEDEPKGWYGQDTYNGKSDYCDLLELAGAIPNSTFDFIWFDCCYMSSIEVMYQLRSKTPYIVAYPTEIDAEGLPYQITLPYLASSEIDLQAAAAATAKYFLDKDGVITICLADTSKLPLLAAEAAKAVPGTRPASIKLQRYTRGSTGPFFDFGQYTSEWGASLGEAWDENAFRDALNDVVIYKAASATGFDRRPIKPENFSGVSCCYFYDDQLPETDYYKTLDWYKDVYKDF